MSRFRNVVCLPAGMLAVWLGPHAVSPAQEVSAPVTVTFAAQANRHPVSGFGGEWDPHFWTERNGRRGCNEAAWRALTDRIRGMGVSRVRTSVLPDWYEPENDNADPGVTDGAAFTWDSEQMRSLRRQLDFCQEAGIRVTLTWWCAPARVAGGKPYWLGFAGSKQWCSAPNDAAECAENVAAVLRHLLVDRGYSCIDAFTFMNEPDWTYLNDENRVDFGHYAEVCRAIHERLVREGLRERLELDLADDSSHRGWLQQTAAALGGVSDRLNAHSYVFSCEDPGYAPAMRAWVRDRVAWCGDLPFCVNELGTRHVQGAYTATDIETFERGFCVAQFALLGLNEGMTGALFWGLHDQYYYDGNPEDGSNGGLMKTNLMAYVTEGWRMRSAGEAWSLVCRGAPRGARAHSGVSDCPEVDGVALVPPDGGGVNLLLVNRADAARKVTLRGIPAGAVSLEKAEVSAFGRNGGSGPEARAWTETTGLELPPETFLLARLSGPKQ